MPEIIFLKEKPVGFLLGIWYFYTTKRPSI
jgi:hypothetical protein